MTIHIDVNPKKLKYSLILPVWITLLLTATIVMILLWH